MKKLGPALLALAFYLLVALVFFSPVTRHFTTHCLAHPQGELYMKLWDQWWTSEGLLRDGSLPQETRLINYPWGGTLFPSDPLNSVLFLPVYATLGLPARYNISPLVHLVLGAFAMFLLVRYLTGSPGAALLAGTAFGFNPFLLGYGVESGCSEAVCVSGFPLLLLFAIRSARESGQTNPILAGAACGFLAWSSLYYGLFGLLLLFVFAGYLAVLRLRGIPVDQGLPGEGAVSRCGDWNRALASRLALLVLVAGLLMSPLAHLISRSVSSPDSIISREELAFRTEGHSARYAELSWSGVIADQVRPGKAGCRVREKESRFVVVTYSGFVLLGLAALALRRRTPFVLFCATSASLFLVLFAGPYLRLTDQVWSGSPINPVYWAFFHGFPRFSVILEPFRLHVMFVLFVAILAGLGMRRWCGEGSGLARGVAAALLVLAEYIVISPLPFPLSVTEMSHPSACRVLAEDSRPYAVVELPFAYRGGPLFYKQVFYFQVLHGRPIPNRVAFYPRLMQESRLFRVLLKLEGPPGERRGLEAVTAEDVRSLSHWGFGRIVVHREAYRPETWEEVSRTLRPLLGAPSDLGGDVEAYDLTRPGGSATAHDAPQAR